MATKKAPDRSATRRKAKKKISKKTKVKAVSKPVPRKKKKASKAIKTLHTARDVGAIYASEHIPADVGIEEVIALEEAVVKGSNGEAGYPKKLPQALFCYYYAANPQSRLESYRLAMAGAEGRSENEKTMKQVAYRWAAAYSALIRELIAKRLQDFSISKAQTEQQLARYTYYDLGSYYTTQLVEDAKTGETYEKMTPKPFSKLTEAQRAAIQEVKVDSHGRVMHYKLVDKLTAIKEAAIQQGMRSPEFMVAQVNQLIERQTNVNVDFSSMETQDLVQVMDVLGKAMNKSDGITIEGGKVGHVST